MPNEKYFSLQKIDLPIEVGGMNIHVTNISHEKLAFSIPPHSHGISGFELHYITSGNGTLIAKDKTFPICSGSLFMTGANMIHEQQNDISNPPSEFCVFFKVISQNMSAKEDDTNISRIFYNTNFWFGTDNTLLPDIIKTIECELTNHYLGYITNIKLALTRLVIGLSRIYSENLLSCEKIRSIEIDENRLQIIDDLFVWHYKNLTLENMANALNLSTRQTEREIYKYFGTTFKKKLNQAKLTSAKRLLSYESYRISDIAEKVGFSSAEYFCVAFKKIYGISPLEYRKKRKIIPTVSQRGNN